MTTSIPLRMLIRKINIAIISYIIRFCKRFAKFYHSVFERICPHSFYTAQRHRYRSTFCEDIPSGCRAKSFPLESHSEIPPELRSACISSRNSFRLSIRPADPVCSSCRPRAPGNAAVGTPRAVKASIHFHRQSYSYFTAR